MYLVVESFTHAPIIFPSFRTTGGDKDGTEFEDLVGAIALTTDGNVVVAGYTRGSLFVFSDGWTDMVAVKLNVDTGAVIWSYQVRGNQG